MKNRCSRFAIAASLIVLLCAHPVRGQAPFAFRDVAEEAGLTPAIAGIQAHGAGWGDVDGDGWLDLYVGTFHYTDTKANLLLRNREGKFRVAADSTTDISTRATGVVFADLDNDGDLDLYVGSMPSPSGGRLASRLGYPLAGCSLFRNDGDGRFTDVSDGNGACPKAFGGRSATVLDYNGDGLLDLLVGEDPLPRYNGSPTNHSRLFRNLGNLKFADASRDSGLAKAAGLGVAAADVNGDGWPDLFLASTLDNVLMVNDRRGGFRELKNGRAMFHWPTAKGDNMVCGVAISDVNGDERPDIVLGQHFGSPWREPVANRLYLNRGGQNDEVAFEDVTDAAGLVPLPLKAPHVEIQDFDNDGRPDIYASLVKFADGNPYPLIFRNLGPNADGVPTFRQQVLQVNDFPTADDREVKRSKTFYAKMLADEKITYAAPGPTGDFDRDGRLDIFLGSWWKEANSLLLRNETKGGNWLDVQVVGRDGVNRMGVGARVRIYAARKPANVETKPIGIREIATGFGYASSQEAVAHFGLGEHERVDIRVDLPHGRGEIRRNNVSANQRIIIDSK